MSKGLTSGIQRINIRREYDLGFKRCSLDFIPDPRPRQMSPLIVKNSIS